MVQTDITHISDECTLWRDQLRQFRENLKGCKDQLLEIVSDTHTYEGLRQVEHFHNQFYIQLINIRDLKHAIKQHSQLMIFENEKANKVSNETFANHDILLEQYQQLKNTLIQLLYDFDYFKGQQKLLESN